MKQNQKQKSMGGGKYITPMTVSVLICHTESLCTSPRVGTADNYTESDLDWDE